MTQNYRFNTLTSKS